MSKFLKQPYPLQLDLKHNIIIGVIAGLCVFCIFYFVHPFGISMYNNKKIAFIGFEYAAITIVLSLFCNVIIPKIIPQLFNEKKWIVLYEILFLLFIITIIAIGNFIFTSYAFKVQYFFLFFLKLLYYTLGFGIVPIFISVFIKQQSLLRKYSAEASIIDALIIEKSKQEINIENIPNLENEELPISKTKAQVKELNIKGNNQKELLQLSIDHFLYAEAADNYTTIHYLKNEILQQVLFRMSIKNIEEQLQLPEILFRCHKSYIINMQKVIHLSGNAQGYSLHIANYSNKIPVSRSLNTIIKEKISYFLLQSQ